MFSYLFSYGDIFFAKGGYGLPNGSHGSIAPSSGLYPRRRMSAWWRFLFFKKLIIIITGKLFDTRNVTIK